MNFRRAASKLEYVRLSALAFTLLLAATVTACSHSRADAPRLAALVEVRPGMVLADIGAGHGATAVAMARLVGPTGHVFAADINPLTLDRLRSMAKAAHFNNVTVVAASARDPQLPSGCCEAILLRRVYHELSGRAGYDASLMRALRPGGDLAVLDFRPTLPWPWRSKGAAGNSTRDGIDPMVVVSEMTGAGFEYIRMIDPWPGSWFVSSYCLLFQKPPQGPAPARPAARLPPPPSAGGLPPGTSPPAAIPRASASSPFP
jgi:ubiquinone/menaquinone biosynthesis C-methylase UbiE